MTRSALALAIILALPAAAATPRAVVQGPARVEPDQPILIQAEGSVSDAPLQIEWAAGPVQLRVSPAFDADGRLVFGTAVPHEPGDYRFAVVAEGRPDKPDGTPDPAAKLTRRYAFLDVAVGPRPAPLPTPPPSPAPDVPTPTPQPQPAPDPAAPGVAIGRAYAPQLLETYAAAWEKGATQVAAGLSSADVATTFGADWQKARTDLFNRVLKPELNRVLPEGAPIADQAQRDAVAKLWRDVAAGLRGAIR
jgi:hypothetical protein